MIHPDTYVAKVNDEIGLGVFAAKSIPKGSIVYVLDPMEKIFSQSQFKSLADDFRYIVERYSYMDQFGNYILSWDHAKYVNHSCECNTISTGYGFEIAIRDIEKHEEITDEYGLFNLDSAVDLNCGCHHCRKRLLPTDIETYHAIWDEKVQGALDKFYDAPQPLWKFLDEVTQKNVDSYLKEQAPYRSVLNLRYLAGTSEVNSHLLDPVLE